jgi:two-component system, chemotaxis family, chemotaxis protein CheY
MANHVLIVDDDPDFAEAVQLTLEAHGIAAEVANNGHVALGMIDVSPPAVIILDMLMPVMDGWSFARELRSRHGKTIPIIVLSAAENVRARAAEIEANDVLPKPFKVARLIECVERLVNPSVRETAL